MSVIMKPDVRATAGVFELLSLSEVDEEAPPDAAGDEDPARKSSKSSEVFCLLDMSMAAVMSRFFRGTDRHDEEEEEVGEGG